ncbi:MAG TPA: transglycosylase domain-containing protein [Terrimicrobiaceae bacterium]
MQRYVRVIREASLRIARYFKLLARRLGFVVFALFTAVFFFWGLVELLIRSANLPLALDQPPPATPALTDFRDRPIAVLRTPLARECYPLKIDDMGEWLPAVSVGIEDARFWKHPGVDFHAMTGAAVRNWRNGRVISGASTITQQIIKVSSGRHARTLFGKASEALAALRLEREWDKRKILESYLNRLDYGNRRIGPEAAALAYFGKPAYALSLSEAIFLAGIPQAPARLDPWRNPNAVLARYRRNVRRLAEIGALPSGAAMDSLLEKPPSLRRHTPPREASQFVELTRQRLPARAKAVSTATAGKIRTSLDLDLQSLATRALREHLSATAALGVGDAAIVIIENCTGAVRALACAGDPRRASLNSAMEPRSCGSALKPFLYLAAIDQRKLTAASLLPDTPDSIGEEYPDYDPQNYSKRYLGPVRVREALGSSLNVPAVFTLSKMGARETFEYLRSWGLNFPGSFDEFGAGFILGNAPVRLLELAGAYAGIARGGVVWTPKLTPKDPIESRRLASEDACAIIADILCDNRARLSSFGASSPLNLPERTAVKTGTSSGFRDGWCVGFNKDHTVAVWAGNLDGRPMDEVLSVRSAAPLWAAMMRSLYVSGDRPWPQMDKTASLRTVEIAAETGLIPRQGEPTIREWFLSGTEPVHHASVLYADGILQLPPEYSAWCAGPQNSLGAVVLTKPLKILFPKDGATFCYNVAMLKSQQMLPLQSSLPGCEWFLNGQRLARPLIPLERGAWTVSARAGGQTAVSNYVVE